MIPLGVVLGWFRPYEAAVATAVVTVLVALLVGELVGRLMRRSNPQMALAARRLGTVVVALIGATLTLQALGASPDILLLVVALLGATILIALREPLGNYGAKFFSDIYTPFKVGDSIRVQGFSGQVIEINAMSTILLSEDEQLVSLPNAILIRDVVVNTSPQKWREITIPVAVGTAVDLPTFESELRKSLAKLRTRLDPRFPPFLTTKARSAQSTDVLLTVMLRRPEDRDAITLEVNQRVAEVLQRVRATRT